MINVELVIAERKTDLEPWIRIKLVAVPRVGDLISLDLVEDGELHGRYVRVDLVVFDANPHENDGGDVVVIHATLLTEDAAHGHGLT